MIDEKTEPEKDQPFLKRQRQVLEFIKARAKLYGDDSQSFFGSDLLNSLRFKDSNTHVDLCENGLIAGIYSSKDTVDITVINNDNNDE